MSNFTYNDISFEIYWIFYRQSIECYTLLDLVRFCTLGSAECLFQYAIVLTNGIGLHAFLDLLPGGFLGLVAGGFHDPLPTPFDGQVVEPAAFLPLRRSKLESGVDGAPLV
jgi:hypothetical protein